METDNYSKLTQIDRNIPFRHPPSPPRILSLYKLEVFRSKKFNFTIAALNKIIAPVSGRDEYRDLKIPELALRVTSKGTKRFSFAKKINGKNVRATLGRFPANTIEQARKKPVKK